MKEDTTIVVQGVLDEVSIDNFKNYKKYADNIVFSVWDTDEARHLLKKVSDEEGVRIALISPHNYILGNKDNDASLDCTYYNNANICLQALTTHVGLARVSSKFVIKVRGDESYEDMGGFLRVIKENPEKMTTNNLFFCRDSIEKFHPSDHVIGGTTENIYRTFKRLTTYCFNQKGRSKHDVMKASEIGVEGLGTMSPETFICLCFLQHKGVKIDADNSVNIMKNNVAMVPCSDMGDFTVKVKGASHNRLPYYLGNSINSMDQL